jgi:long-chain fatty acid transport protein
LTRQLALRVGIGFDLSPIGDDVRTYRLPTNDGLSLSLGASYRHDERLSFDIGYSLGTVEDTEIRAAGAGGGPDVNGPFSGRADTRVHFLAAAIKVRL